ncbi:pitrilysin family protein [Streptomyces sp. NPDC005648]|uniref:M16 family metallopeptidase n=1 Tax=Streptomyces sp. NPDC005648 TaxID=3157044 RepID=UPI00339FF1F6
MTPAATAVPAAIHRGSPGLGRSACAMVFVAAGSWSDPPGRSGLAHLWEHAFFAGSGPHRTARDIAAAVSELGHTFNAHTAAEYAYFYLSGPDDTLDRAVDLLLTCYTAPRWDDGEMAIQRRAIDNELRIFADDRQRRVRQLATEALHGPGPFALPPLGRAAEIAGLTGGDVAAFARDHAGPDRLTVLIDSPAHDSRLDDVIARHFAPRQSRPAAGPAPTGYGPLTHLALELPGRTAVVALATPGVSYRLTTREMYAVRLFHSVLGGIAGSRLGTRLRDELGLAYQARTVLEPHAATGALITLFTCAPDRVAEAVRAVTRLLDEALDAPVSEAELARAVAMNRGIHVRDRETPTARCLVDGREILRRGTPLPEQEQFALWGDIGAEEVLATARRVLLPRQTRCAVVGPQGTHHPLTETPELPGAWKLVG